MTSIYSATLTNKQARYSTEIIRVKDMIETGVHEKNSVTKHYWLDLTLSKSRKNVKH